MQNFFPPTPATLRTPAWFGQTLAVCPVMAIVRISAPADLVTAVESLVAGGIRLVEITLPSPGCLEAVTKLRHRQAGGPLRIGVGTVLNSEEAKRAVGAGAEFLVTPILDERTIEESVRQGVPILPGVFSPTEAWRAWSCGSDFVKLFPADSLNPEAVRAWRAPLPMLQVVAVGGVTRENVGTWLRAGAAGVAVGSGLAPQAMIEKTDQAGLTREARAWVEAVRPGN